MRASSIAAEVEGVEGQPVSAQTIRRTLHQEDTVHIFFSGFYII